jgi:hypothetical protein
MPTARELLEQADALMRRNRAATESARPDPQPGGVGWSAPVPGSTSPRTIQREPIPPSTARTSLPVDPTESPIFSIGEPAQTPDHDVPVLTQPVEAAAEDDVPLLTDVVEEIDVGIVDEAVRGEPSIWDVATRGEASVLGRGPDSLALVPPTVPAELPITPPEGRDPLGLDQPAPGFEASPFADSLETPADAPAESPVEPAVAATTDAGEPIIVADEWNPVDEAVLPPPMPGTPVDAPLAAAASAPADEARIREIAEEIGMQVLQRIDIFSDTTLPAQLGERLKPVVERASADLVAAINQHVGELVRAYIAEAIAREIESWRKGR